LLGDGTTIGVGVDVEIETGLGERLGVRLASLVALASAAADGVALDGSGDEALAHDARRTTASTSHGASRSIRGPHSFRVVLVMLTFLGPGCYG
jgi:hypothetical protein